MTKAVNRPAEPVRKPDGRPAQDAFASILHRPQATSRCLRPDHRHRAPRLPRAPRRRGAERGDRVAPAAHRHRARPRAEAPGLPPGQGAARDGDPAHGARSGARAGGARLAAGVVRGGDHALGRLDGGRPEARPHRAARRRRAAQLLDRGRHHAAGQARPLQGARGRPARARRARGGGPGRARPAAGVLRAARQRRAARPSRAITWSSTSSAGSTARSSRAARRATTCSSSAAGA